MHSLPYYMNNNLTINTLKAGYLRQQWWRCPAVNKGLGDRRAQQLDNTYFMKNYNLIPIPSYLLHSGYYVCNFFNKNLKIKKKNMTLAMNS